MKRDPTVTEFYNSIQWQQCREAYKAAKGGLCERCLERGIYSPAEIIHHKKHVTPRTVNNPKITLSFDNLMCVCRKCHAEIHEEIYGHDQRRYYIDSNGRVVSKS